MADADVRPVNVLVDTNVAIDWLNDRNPEDFALGVTVPVVDPKDIKSYFPTERSAGE